MKKKEICTVIRQKEIGDGIKTVTKRGVEVLKSAVFPDNN